MEVNMAVRFECPEVKLVVPAFPVSESKNVFRRKVYSRSCCNFETMDVIVRPNLDLGALDFENIKATFTHRVSCQH